MMEIKGKRVLVVGLRKSGVSAANLLAGSGAEVTVTDMLPADELGEFAGKLLPSVRLALGGHPNGLFEGTDLIVLSPGVPTGIEPIKKARLKGIKVIGELELAYLMAGGAVPFYAVTGTNGKSTTVTLLDLMLRKAGKKTLFGGNIGNAMTGEVQKTGDCAVVEVSSFQLETIETFRPHIAVILNITPDHMDRYRSMDEYREAKERISLNQTRDDFLVLNHDDPETMAALKKDIKAQVFYFSRAETVKGVYTRAGVVYTNIDGPAPLIGANEIRIKGVHNLENAMAASAMALLAGVPPDAVREALREFPGLPHRLEFVRELGGVRFVNDSKGTNIGAVAKSLEGFEKGVVLIAGGRDKAGDFTALRPLIKGRVKAVVLIGEAAEKIEKAVCDLTGCRYAGSMEEAVRLAMSLASKGDTVLLSPACASFDMFRDFEDRGRVFKEAVCRL